LSSFIGFIVIFTCGVRFIVLMAHDPPSIDAPPLNGQLASC